jgi:hypothetical protein
MIGSKLTLAARVLTALAVTTGVLLSAFAVMAWLGASQSGTLGVASAAVACGVCWVSGVIALGSMLLFRDPQQAVQGLFLGMIVRMGLPLVVGLGLFQSRSPLLGAGVMGMMISAYLLGLAVETALTWWIVGTASSAVPPGAAKVS